MCWGWHMLRPAAPPAGRSHLVWRPHDARDACRYALGQAGHALCQAVPQVCGRGAVCGGAAALLAGEAADDHRRVHGAGKGLAESRDGGERPACKRQQGTGAACGW